MVVAAAAAAALGGGIGWAARSSTALKSPGRYPATPRQWFDAYMAAAVDDPGRVCDLLFSPQLAARYGHGPRSSCLRYYADVSNTSVTVERVVRFGETAVVHLMQRNRARSPWYVVLTRRDGGWQAVDLLSGP
jgi:hypothetical protein